VNSLIALSDRQKVSLDPKAMNIKQGEVNMLTIVDFWESLFAKIGFTTSHNKWLRRNWSYRFRNSLIEFFDEENMGLDTKITLLWQLEPEILTKVRLGGGRVEIWPPTVVKSNFSSFNVKNIVCRKILENMVPFQTIYSRTTNVIS